MRNNYASLGLAASVNKDASVSIGLHRVLGNMVVGKQL